MTSKEKKEEMVINLKVRRLDLTLLEKTVMKIGLLTLIKVIRRVNKSKCPKRMTMRMMRTKMNLINMPWMMKKMTTSFEILSLSLKS